MVLLISFFIPAIIFTESHGLSPPGGGSSSASAWKVAAATAVVGWLVSPVITFFLPKIISRLGFDASEKLRQLEIHIVPELQMTLRVIDQERMLEREKKEKGVVAALDKMSAMLRHAREEAEDICDDHEDMELYRNGCWQRLHGAVKGCITRYVRSSSLSRWLLRRRSGNALPVVNIRAAASFLCSTFHFFSSCCEPIFYWSVDVIQVARSYRNWSYAVVGITNYQQENATALDFVLTAMSRQNLKKRIDKVESIISEVKKSPLLSVTSKDALKYIANKNRTKIRTASNHKVFGREALRDSIMPKICETPHPSSSTSPCYSAIGIYGVAGSGKTTFARYTRDYINELGLFDTVICIHVSETFSVDVIFHEMLKDITQDRHSHISDHEELEEMVKQSLCGKRFFLILDDLWVKNKNDPQLEELISPLNVGLKGSKILVTARTKVAAGVLCADEPMQLPDLDKDQYLSMFMHYALGGTRVADDEFKRVGRVISEKLHGSPIAAVIVAGRLGANRSINFWKNTADRDMLNDTMDALWWSYQPINPDIRRCFEFCNIFPRRCRLKRDELIRMWIGQGFVKTSCATEDMEDVAEGYIQELVSCSFLQPEQSTPDTDFFTIHDLVHDLLDNVAGSDFFRIENASRQRVEGLKGDVPRDVRHLFVGKYVEKLITEKILRLENLRTLIIYVADEIYRSFDEKIIESICKRLPKLRILAVSFGYYYAAFVKQRYVLSVPESIGLLKHLRYLSFRRFHQKVILPSKLSKLHHIQLLDFGPGIDLDFPSAGLAKLRHIFCRSDVKFPNLANLTSLQTLPSLTVRNEQGYEVKQLRDLNKLRGSLRICGLGNVKSKEEALEANLSAKERLRNVSLWFHSDGARCSPEVEAEVLDGICPPVRLETLEIIDYKGSRYPDWMVGKHNGCPKDLQALHLSRFILLGPGPQLEAFPRLRVLHLSYCLWDALPSNMEHLTSLKELEITGCKNIRSLPSLPQSLEKFILFICNDEFHKSCRTVGDPNWQKIEHIPWKEICP